MKYMYLWLFIPALLFAIFWEVFLLHLSNGTENETTFIIVREISICIVLLVTLALTAYLIYLDHLIQLKTKEIDQQKQMRADEEKLLVAQLTNGETPEVKKYRLKTEALIKIAELSKTKTTLENGKKNY